MTWAAKNQRVTHCLYLKACFRVGRIRGLLVLVGLVWLLTTANAQSTDGPRSPGTATNTALAGSAASWSNVSNALSSDNSYATASLNSSGNFSDYIELTNFGFSLSNTDIILGIVVEIERFGNNIKDNQISIIKGGVIGSTDRATNASWAGSDPNTYETYGGSTDLWGETWSASDINASDFGVAISTRRQGGGGSRTASIDHVRITIYFDIPLPVGLLSFDASPQSEEVRLNWSTSWEEGNSHFEVQRAGYDLNFNTIGFVPGGRNSESTLHYHFTDDSPLCGRAFYRLIQHDFNGNYSVSELVAIDNKDCRAQYRLYPTLINSPIRLEIKNAAPEEHRLIFYSATGLALPPIHTVEKETFISPDFFQSPGVYTYRLFHKQQMLMNGKVIKP